MGEIKTLYRGIQVPSDQLNFFKNELVTKGITGASESIVHWQDLRNVSQQLFENVDLTIEQTRKTEGVSTDPYIFATGDRSTGVFYACRQRPHMIPVLITFEAEISSLIVDPRDFLATIFQSPDAVGSIFIKQKEILSKMYGEAILPYFERAKKTQDLHKKLALLDLACVDLDVINAHFQNPVILEGRMGVPITSIFYVKVPIQVERIKAVEVVSPNNIVFETHFRNFL
ncbi:hypothetical protein COJ85_11675 [Bacillus sp. AFS076308]|uniref:hypothetical protein n=1 Tax=Bacillus sp. AFS076308 TaxID=2033512 RepID=UPI000BF65ECC|nr:hypothetical protein [Bacillus sp. AFS076308]PFO04684.1 hypothetical protein COJ85_11675 [Bacillus sp. AFS076308]